MTPAAKDAASRAAELFLAHRLFRTLGSGQVIRRTWLAPHYPPYWHYDILQALLVLSRMGKAGRTPAPATPSTSWNGGGCLAAAGNPAAAGGNRPAAPSPPKSWTGAGQARTR